MASYHCKPNRSNKHTNCKWFFKFCIKVVSKQLLIMVVPNRQQLGGLYSKFQQDKPSTDFSLHLIKPYTANRDPESSASLSVIEKFVHAQRLNLSCDMCSGWLNSHGSAQIPLYVMMTLLHDEASLVPIKVCLVSDNKVKRHQS